MIYKNREILVSEIIDALPDMRYAELVQMTDFVRGLIAAREFLARH